MSAINQKDYLRKYLKIGKKTGKKKKKDEKPSSKRLKIIDDDIDTSLSQEIQDDIDAANEDAPQIVAVIDERPPSLRIHEETKNPLWQPLGEATSTPTFKSFKMNSIRLNNNKEQDKYSSIKDISSKKKIGSSSPKSGDQSYQRRNIDYSSPRRNRHDQSPPRKSKIADQSPPRKRRYDQSPDRLEDDCFPSNKRREEDHSPPRKRKEEDQSLPRKRREEDQASSRKRREEDHSPPRKRREEDHSPQRKRREEDQSPQRKRREEDHSPPRKRREEDKASPRKIKEDDQSRNRKNNRSPQKAPRDNSVPQRSRTDDRLPSTKSIDKEKKKDEFRSPRNGFDSDQSPQRKSRMINESHSSRNKHDDKSFPRKSKKSRWGEQEDNSPPAEELKPAITLSGKKSGLQNAKNVADDIIRIQQQEEIVFKTLSTDISGAHAATVVRKKKHQVEPDPEKEMREAELKEKFSHWGKGVKQVQNEQEKMADQLKEMNKPFARHVDDEDLERYLKEQEREGDPMLAYLSKKKKKAAKEQGIPTKPMFMGDFMPNRFGIPPGYRWDGVDRSNGYEKKWFQVENSKRAMQDEALRWSQEDM